MLRLFKTDEALGDFSTILMGASIFAFSASTGVVPPPGTVRTSLGAGRLIAHLADEKRKIAEKILTLFRKQIKKDPEGLIRQCTPMTRCAKARWRALSSLADDAPVDRLTTLGQDGLAMLHDDADAGHAQLDDVMNELSDVGHFRGAALLVRERDRLLNVAPLRAAKG
jgi:hypothetical protein